MNHGNRKGLVLISIFDLYFGQPFSILIYKYVYVSLADFEGTRIYLLEGKRNEISSQQYARGNEKKKTKPTWTIH
jgi:hypothetical protein